MDSISTWQIALVTGLAAIAVPFIFYPQKTLHKLRTKRYQYEVTFGLYMLTPTEKFILNSIFFLLISMVTLASVIYLPSHLRQVSKRAFYYLSGTFTYPSYSLSSVSEGVQAVNSKIQDSISNASPDQLYEVSQRMAEGASDMAKGIVAAAAGSAAGSPADSAPEPVEPAVVAEPADGANRGTREL